MGEGRGEGEVRGKGGLKGNLYLMLVLGSFRVHGDDEEI